MTAPRAELLDDSKNAIMGDRNNQYGPPTQDFTRTADVLTALGYGREGQPLQAYDIAIIVAMVKVSRIMWSPGKRDHWLDLAGYAACGWECAEEAGAFGLPQDVPRNDIEWK
jgi:hypothetical protein